MNLAQLDLEPKPDVALFYAAQGVPVFPIEDKKPATRHGQNDATRDPDQIRRWFYRDPAWAGLAPPPDIAARTGIESGLVVIDVDIRADKNGLDALEEVFGLAANPETPTSHTPSGGLHWWFQHPGADWFVKSVTGLVQGIDVKADRSSCSLPPSDSGRRWDPLLNPQSVPFAPLPDWVPREPRRRADAQYKEPPSTEGWRNLSAGHRLHAYGKAALRSACKAVTGAANGTQNETLNREAFGVGRLVGGREIDLDEARRLLLWAAEMMPAHAEPWRRPDLESTIDRALAEGQRRPRERPRR